MSSGKFGVCPVVRLWRRRKGVHGKSMFLATAYDVYLQMADQWGAQSITMSSLHTPCYVLGALTNVW